MATGARVVSDADRDRVIRFANVAALVSDAVGVFCFRPVSNSQPTTYRTEAVPSHVALDRVLFRACQDLTSVKKSPPVDPLSPSPATMPEQVPMVDKP